MNMIEKLIMSPALRRELEKQSSHCDYCDQEVDSTELTSEHKQICPDCRDEAPWNLRLIDPDRAYDDWRDRNLI